MDKGDDNGSYGDIEHLSDDNGDFIVQTFFGLSVVGVTHTPTGLGYMCNDYNSHYKNREECFKKLKKMREDRMKGLEVKYDG